MASALQADWLSEPEEDPRIAAAVADFRGAVIDIRRLSAELFTTAEGTTKRSVLQAHIDDLVGGMQARAEMVGLTLDQLFALINAELKRKRVGNDHQPHGDHLRAITDENTSAHADEARLHREIDRLQKLMPAAVDRRLAADRACAGYCAGWALRGRARA